MERVMDPVTMAAAGKLVSKDNLEGLGNGTKTIVSSLTDPFNRAHETTVNAETQRLQTLAGIQDPEKLKLI